MRDSGTSLLVGEIIIALLWPVRRRFRCRPLDGTIRRVFCLTLASHGRYISSLDSAILHMMGMFPALLIMIPFIFFDLMV